METELGRAAPKILVVDDEEGIRCSLQRVFRDEGFETVEAQNGVEALAALRAYQPDLILLDIWMPGMDGIETLKQIKTHYPNLPVIMISGHATVSTAVHATKIGASDFIEKPLDLEATLKAVKRVLGLEVDTVQVVSAATQGAGDFDIRVGVCTDLSRMRRVVGRYAGWRGRSVGQRTLAHSALLYGHGVHTGQKSGLILEPLPPGCGIHFCRMSEEVPVPGHLDFVESTAYATVIKDGQAQFGTIEHLMSALHAYRITNLLVKCNGEVPVMDGSAREFCELIEQVGLEEQPGEWFEIEVRERLEVGVGAESICIEPADGFVVDYTLNYPAPLGRQRLVFEMESASFRREIADARTFGFVKDIGALQKAGLALGGRFDNFVLIGEEGAINAKLRYADEAVRHKILDVIGDFYLLGRPIRGKITAVMTGHADNVALLRKIRERIKDEVI